MNAYDPEKAARVWQRVQGREPAPAVSFAQELRMLIAEEWNDAAAYLNLSRRFQGAQNALLRRMSQEEQSHAACLRGLYSLITGTRLAVQTSRPTQEPTEVILRRCYGREMRSLAEYEARSADSEYGPVFARLAAQEREHCKSVLELLGSLRGTN